MYAHVGRPRAELFNGGDSANDTQFIVPLSAAFYF